LSGREVKVSRVARTLAIGAIVLAAASGLAFGLLLPSVAHADDPPTTTIPTPTLPVPDPAPPKTTPKPTPKPAPKPSPSRQVSHAPAYTPPAPTVHAQVKPKPKTVRHKKVVVKKETTTTTTLPTVTIAPVGAVGVPAALGPKSGGSFNLGSLLVVLGLSLAIACLAIAVVPATYVKWRPAAIFVSERQVDLTVIGLGLLVVTAFMLVLTKGP
jgi:hypothetical protein